MKKIIHYSVSESKGKHFVAAIFVMMLLTFFPFSKSFSNGLVISNVTYDQSVGTVTFDISWKNSWRKSDWTAKNWDAAWVFVKWRYCTDPATTQFTHGLVDPNVASSSFNLGTTTFEPTLKNGTGNSIDASPNNTGVMLRNASDLVSGDVSGTVTLQLTNLAATNGNTIDLRIFGIEMVFVPSNPYVLGDGNGVLFSTNSFTSVANPGNPNIFGKAILSENAQTVSEKSTFLGSLGSYDLTAAYQKGYGAFYVMKYEISQGQYADFLNATNSSSQIVHYLSTGTGTYRLTLTNSGTPPTQYAADRPDRACNFLSWADVSTFLDWAALRPLTELEYEKSCRGPEPAVAYQKSWGTNSGTRATTISCPSCSPAEDGTETISTASANVNTGTATTWSGGDAGALNGQGPLRGGIFATGGTTTRIETGMGFYGAMELTGNVTEYYISALAGLSSGVSASGAALGDGMLNGATGYQDVGTWPNATAPGNSIIRRGGSWSTSNGANAADLETNISYRATTSGVADNTTGGRGGR